MLNILMPEESNEMMWNWFTVQVPGSGAAYVPKTDELFYNFI